MAKTNPILSNRIRFDGVEYTLADLAAQCDARVARLGATRGRLALVSDSGLELAAAAAWLAQTRVDGLILPAERLTNPLRERLHAEGFEILDLTRQTRTDPTQTIEPHGGRVTLLTSGTTGEPKLIEHTWETLFTMNKVRAARPCNWLLTYQPGTYAWFQMLTLALFVPNQTLTLTRERNPVSLFAAAKKDDVTAISATPTLWRLAFLQVSQEDLRALKLQQITLGGEAVDQPMLDHLHRLYPDVTLSHIYASTEAGACIVVRDGKEGFPAAWLTPNSMTKPADTPQLELRDGFLWIQSPYAFRNQSGWLNSGDRIELRGDRAIILGRAETAFINVGGAKVAAREVEAVLLQHPAILWCQVHRCPAPFMGELVGADLVFRPGERQLTEAALTDFCAKRVAEHMVPRIWKFLSEIPVTENLKSKLA